MNDIIITDRDDWKLKALVKQCDMPTDVFHVCLTGEQYKDGKMTEKSSYDFFLKESELIHLSNFLLKRS